MKNKIVSKKYIYKRICTETPAQRAKRCIEEKEEEEQRQENQ
jgi:hypothetical protein